MFSRAIVHDISLMTSISILLLTAACGVSEKNKRSSMQGLSQITPRQMDGDAQADGKASDPKPESPDQDASEGEPIAKIQAKIGLKNYDQINASMSVITGVPSTTSAVRTAFNDLSTSLPTDNDIKGFIGSHQVSVFKLAVEYCDALVRDQTRRAAFFPGFNFAGTPNAVLNLQGKQAIAESLVTKIWGKDFDFLPNHTETVASVVALIDDILVGKNMNQANVTTGVVTGACTAVLASAPAVMY